MAPAQALACVDEEKKPDFVVKSENQALVEVEDAAISMCTNKCEDNIFCLKSSGHLKKEDDANDQEEVDVINCSGSAASALAKEDDPDATEYSSSFGNTCSGSDCESKRDVSDMEVDSPCFVQNDSAVHDGYKRVFKKKKVTAQWRKYISPLIWRCQWLELRMKELHSQASKYDKELASYKREKDVQSKMVELNSSVSRSVSLAFRGHPKQTMRRRKRKRDEDKINISSYTSNHVIFSYYEKKKMETDGHSIDDDYGDVDENIRGNDDEGLLGFNSSDSRVEQILSNIEALQTRATKLKVNLDKLISRHIREMSSYPGNLLPDYQPANAHSDSGSPKNNGYATAGAPGTSPHHVSEYEMEDVVMPESAVSSYGDAADLDIIEDTVALLCAPQLTHGPPIGDFCKDTEEDILINNHMTDKDYEDLEKFLPVIEKVPDIIKKEPETSGDESTAPEISMPETRTARKKVCKPQQEVLKPCYSGKKRGRKPKRRRGGSAAASGPWRSERLQKKRRLSGKKT